MTKIRLLVLLAVVALVLFPAIAYAQGGPPCRFHGTVQVSGADVADGTVITATVDGDTYSATTSASSYGITIAQPEAKSYDGKTVTFKIGNDTAGQTATWTMGDNVAVNLTKGTPPPTIGPSGISGVQLGDTTGYDPVTGMITIKKADITGPKGDTGAIGPAGAKGDTGKAASNVIGIVAIVLAAIAIIVAIVVMLRKPAKA